MSSTHLSKVYVLGHVLASVLFVAMAALQINDPDPLLWVTVYVAIALVPAARIIGYRLPILFWATVGMATACLLISLPGFFDYLASGDFASVGEEMSATKPYIEPAREFLGIVIGAICLACYRNSHGKTDGSRT